jgi:hypothetical protein
MPELRRPTDRNVAWASWRARIEGRAADQPITSVAECGWYRAKRHGQHVAVQIDLVQEVDPDTGELTAPESFVAFVGADTFYEQSKIEEIWLRCGGSPITEAEAERLLKMPAVSDLSRQVIV